eukprot:TRINITY_DN7449_c0_g1_i1.p3 TRINITY_DN7449_c0_g1~~TRINITY_DN7449_c0_g1_i1.p3  ORF type:complete len:124 (+),score=21.73 TRINITY_DN7449_c0_g1_i1:1-372(+)
MRSEPHVLEYAPSVTFLQHQPEHRLQQPIRIFHYICCDQLPQHHRSHPQSQISFQIARLEDLLDLAQPHPLQHPGRQPLDRMRILADPAGVAPHSGRQVPIPPLLCQFKQPQNHRCSRGQSRS